MCITKKMNGRCCGCCLCSLSRFCLLCRPPPPLRSGHSAAAVAVDVAAPSKFPSRVPNIFFCRSTLLRWSLLSPPTPPGRWLPSHACVRQRMPCSVVVPSTSPQRLRPTTLRWTESAAGSEARSGWGGGGRRGFGFGVTVCGDTAYGRSD